MTKTLAWTLSDWRTAYADGARPSVLLTDLIATLTTAGPALISVLDQEGLQTVLDELADRVQQLGGNHAQLPLYGVPFVVKDNIDAMGFPTTAGCAEFAYTPSEDAFAVAQLKAAGAIVVGKTNLDQFATGLVGTRSPYGAVPNSFDQDYISGGSSSGSATLVARGLVPFSLGTDTAGSGRVPAAFNNIVGLKGTRGALSIRGVVPACRSLDCVSIFALTLADAATVFNIAAVYDIDDPYSRPKPPAVNLSLGARPRIAVPDNPIWFDDELNAESWQRTLSQWQDMPADLVPLDFGALQELATLLYEGPWVAERHAAVADFMASHAEAMNPVVRDIISKAHRFSATDCFNAQYRQAELRRDIELLLTDIDALLVPTAPTFPTLKSVAEQPVARNTELGTYTNFVNLSDMCALAVPAGFRADGLPFGITLIGRTWQDIALQQLAAQWLSIQPPTLGSTGKPGTPCPVSAPQSARAPAGYIRVAVVGAHLSGMPLNSQLTERNAVLVEETQTAPHYRLHALANTTPPKPGLEATASDGASIVVELWDMPEACFGSFVALIPAPLGIGTLTLLDGRTVKGFICEPRGLADARNITEFGGWRAYIAASQETH